MLYSNQELKNIFKAKLVERILQIEQPPALFVVQIGDNSVSNKYVAMKSKLAEEIGIPFKWLRYPPGTSIEVIQNSLENFKKGDGIIYQLPISDEFLPLIAQIPTFADVDLMGENAGYLEYINILPPTIGAIDLLLKNIILGEEFEIDNELSEPLNLAGKIVGVVGQGELIGKPLVRYLAKNNATIINVNIDTPSPDKLIKNCDIVVTAIGKNGVIDRSWLKEDAIIIDAGTSEGENSIVGDVSENEIYESNILCTTPRGVGGITVLYLFWNLLELYNISQ
jgi:methylenetetrahydrofolate dehydrogenase (NADP+) / methenyltetrahydrofolate cyclohydrolase